MSSNQRNDLDYSEDQLLRYSDNTVIDVSAEKTDDGHSSRYVLIKHDYYSTDSAHGREMLSSFISALCESQYNSIILYLTDKGTLLLDEDNPLYSDAVKLINRSEIVIADKESIDQYEVDCSENPKVCIRSLRSLTEDLIYLSDILVLE